MQKSQNKLISAKQNHNHIRKQFYIYLCKPVKFDCGMHSDIQYPEIF